MTIAATNSNGTHAVQGPSGWTTMKLRFLLDVNPTTPAELRAQGDRLVPFVPMEALGEDGSLDTTRERPVAELATGYSYFANGDVLMAKVTPCFENGKAALVRALSGEHGFGSTEITALRASEGLDPAFLYYLVSSNHFREASIASMTGAGGLKRVPDEQIRSFEALVPSEIEQRTIAVFLDRETAKIDALIDKQEQLIATLREDRAATITHAVTKGLDPNAPLRETGTKWIDTIPENWTLSRFSRHIVINSGQVDPRLEPYRSMTLIAPNHVESRTGKLLETESAEEQGADSGKYRVSAGQVIYSKIRPNLAKATIAPVDCLCSADMYGLSTDPHELFSKFLLYEILSQPFTDYVIDSSMRVAMPKVNHDSLGAAPIWFPPIEEQYTIVEFLDSRCASIDALIGKSTEMIEVLREYRSALITNAVTGKIDVREAV